MAGIGAAIEGCVPRRGVGASFQTVDRPEVFHNAAEPTGWPPPVLGQTAWPAQQPGSSIDAQIATRSNAPVTDNFISVWRPEPSVRERTSPKSQSIRYDLASFSQPADSC
jgi:hypothetical protein